jgi:hypothetical protein
MNIVIKGEICFTTIHPAMTCSLRSSISRLKTAVGILFQLLSHPISQFHHRYFKASTPSMLFTRAWPISFVLTRREMYTSKVRGSVVICTIGLLIVACFAIGQSDDRAETLVRRTFFAYPYSAIAINMAKGRVLHEKCRWPRQGQSLKFGCRCSQDFLICSLHVEQR